MPSLLTLALLCAPLPFLLLHRQQRRPIPQRGAAAPAVPAVAAGERSGTIVGGGAVVARGLQVTLAVACGARLGAQP